VARLKEAQQQQQQQQQKKEQHSITQVGKALCSHMEKRKERGSKGLRFVHQGRTLCRDHRG
jgi:hypothetical protein